MTARPRLEHRPDRVNEIIAAAREILESEGREALTMRRLAESLGIRAPSIYKHLPHKHAIEVALIELGLLEMGEHLHRALAGVTSDHQVTVLLTTYRARARSHPNLYRLCTSGPLPRRELPPDLEEWAGEPFSSVTGDPRTAQALWAFAHGMVVLELDGRFPPGSDLARTWHEGALAFA